MLFGETRGRYNACKYKHATLESAIDEMVKWLFTCVFMFLMCVYLLLLFIRLPESGKKACANNTSYNGKLARELKTSEPKRATTSLDNITVLRYYYCIIYGRVQTHHRIQYSQFMKRELKHSFMVFVLFFYVTVYFAIDSIDFTTFAKSALFM